MLDYLRFRYRRQARRLKRDIRLWQRWSSNYIDRHIWGKWHQLGTNRRFLLAWWGIFAVALIGLMSQYTSLLHYNRIIFAVAGGTYTEATMGDLKVLNPILPGSSLEMSANRLIFSGLTQYNNDRKLVGDLATKWEVSTDGKVYTFHLRKGVKWQDGVPFTATDVAFTLAAIQNPDSRSPLASSWQGVKVDTKGDDTVVFTLPSPLDSFMDSTTLGIVPRHILESVEPSRLAEASFSTNPVGTGPFEIKTFSPAAREVTLSGYADYYNGKPKLDELILRSYEDSASGLDAFVSEQVNSPGRITPETAVRAAQTNRLAIHHMTLPNETAIFFQNNFALFTDNTLRATLSRVIDRDAILKAATDGSGLAVTQPILPGQLGYTDNFAQSPLSVSAANKTLDEAGWKLPAGKWVRAKNSKQLSFELVTVDVLEYKRAADEASRQWAQIGVEAKVKTVDMTDLQQSFMRPRNFQALLFGMNLGADPDVYSFWHSSQAKDPGVNLASYSSTDADKALESGRIKSDPAVRQGKYAAFLRAWNADEPAVILYQSGYDYGTVDTVRGIIAQRLVSPTDRYFGVEKWTVRTRWSDSK